MDRKLGTGIVLGLIMGLGGGALWIEDQMRSEVDAAAEALAKAASPAPKEISFGDYLFGCRKPTDCPQPRN